MISRLETRGYLERTVSETDRRARTLRLTPSGDAILNAIEAAVLRAQRSMLQGLTDSERATLLVLLRKATDAGNELSRAPLRLVEPAQG